MIIDQRPVRVLSDDELTREITALRERLEALRHEKRRRAISLDGDIGRREARSR